MYYRRNEPFRYSFGQPISAELELVIKEEQSYVAKGKWDAAIIDISPNGIKLMTEANLDRAENPQIRVSFTLNETPIIMHGEISWKTAMGKNFEYGILGNNSDQVKELLVSELKVFAKNHRK